MLEDEWKLVRHQPKYMTGAHAFESSGSKRKSGSGDFESDIHSLGRPEGRDATKKKARAASSKSSGGRKAKVNLAEEWSNLSSFREDLTQARASHNSAIQEYNRNKKLELWLSLKNKEYRDDDDEAAYNMLKMELFDN